MNLQTKMNINDRVFFLHEKKVCDSIIRKINIETNGEVTDVLYLCNKEENQRIHLKVEEQYAFSTKELLLKSL